jgi:fructokinase
MTLFGGIEGGGTKFICAVGTGPGDIRAETRFQTTTPQETLSRVIAFFKEQEQPLEGLAALGMASFGPIDPRPGSPTYGQIMPTPKPGWTGADLVSMLKAAFDIPIGFDLDVNAAALAEWRWGALQNCDPAIYVTVGTGIGGGILINGSLVHGLLHPEMGHVLLPHDRESDPFPGSCPFHGDCFEGLATGPAMEKRWGQKAETLPVDHPAWALEAHYISVALADYILTLSPQRIVLGGGVMQQPQLFPMIHREVKSILNGYVQSPQVLDRIEGYIVPTGLGGRAGVLGAIALAQQAREQNPKIKN